MRMTGASHLSAPLVRCLRIAGQAFRTSDSQRSVKYPPRRPPLRSWEAVLVLRAIAVATTLVPMAALSLWLRGPTVPCDGDVFAGWLGMLTQGRRISAQPLLVLSESNPLVTPPWSYVAFMIV